MTPPEQKDLWASAACYEPYVGRWSRLVAREFLLWLAVPPHACWLDIGCGTGALSQIILEVAAPQLVRGIDTKVLMVNVPVWVIRCPHILLF